MTSDGRMFVLKGRMKFADLAESFLGSLQRVESLLSRTREPFVAKIYADGGVVRWVTRTEWHKRLVSRQPP